MSLILEAAALNKASDDLSAAAAKLEEVIKRLNLGVEGWVSIPVRGHDRVELGYTKIGGKWGLAIAERAEDIVWQFSDAPRTFRIVAAAHVEELIGCLRNTAFAFRCALEKDTTDLLKIVDALNIEAEG